MYSVRMRILVRAAAVAVTMSIALFSANAEPLKNATSQPSRIATEHEIILDYGTIVPGQSELEMNFDWINDSPKDLKISRVLTSCRCSVVSYPEDSIASGETSRFRLVVSLDSWKGNAQVSAVVIFEDKARLPIQLKGRFFIPERFHSLPERVDFGQVTDAANVKRGFILPWVSEPENAGLTIPEGDGVLNHVSYRLVDRRNDVVRLPNSEKASREQRYTFEVSLVPETPVGLINETLNIPVKIDGKDHVAVVPIRARILPRYHAIPSAVVHIYPTDTVSEATVIKIRSRSPVTIPVSISAKVDPSITTISIKKLETDNSDRPVIAELTLQPVKAKGGTAERRDDKVRITVAEGQDNYEVDVPVSYIPVSAATLRRD